MSDCELARKATATRHTSAVNAIMDYRILLQHMSPMEFTTSGYIAEVIPYLKRVEDFLTSAKAYEFHHGDCSQKVSKTNTNEAMVIREKEPELSDIPKLQEEVRYMVSDAMTECKAYFNDELRQLRKAINHKFIVIEGKLRKW